MKGPQLEQGKGINQKLTECLSTGLNREVAQGNLQQKEKHVRGRTCSAFITTFFFFFVFNFQ